MFTPKPSSKQKTCEKAQEHETGDAVTLQLSGKVTFSTQKLRFNSDFHQT
jgi:hypothetical protein